MGLLANLSVLICTSLLSVDSRGLLAPKKEGAAQIKNVTAKVSDDELEMAPPMEPFENTDIDVDEDADSKQVKGAEDELHEHHPGRMFGVHQEGEKDSVNKRQHVDPMDAVHTHRLGDQPGKVRKAASPTTVQKAKQSSQPSHLNALKDLVGADDQETPKPATKTADQNSSAVKPENKTETVSAETAAEVEKMKAWRAKEKAAEMAPKKVNSTTQAAAPKKPHNLGKDLAKISSEDMAPLDDKLVAKLKEAMPTGRKPVVTVPSVHEHEHGDAIGRLHAHAAAHKVEDQATAVVHTTTAVPEKRKATPQQLAAARKASALTDALRNVNASDVELNLDVSTEAAQKIRNIEAKVKSETEQMEQASKQKPVAEDHMEQLRATAERALEEKVHHIAEKKAQKAAAKQEPVSKLAEAVGINEIKEAQATLTANVAPATKPGAVVADPIKALHQRIEESEPKKQVEKPKAAPEPVQQQKVEEPEEGVISGFHHNKARDNLSPVLR